MEQKTIGKALAACCGGLALWTLWGNTALTVTPVAVSGRRIPAGFDGFRVAQLSDLHNAEFGKGNGRLLGLLEKLSPDIIAVTGDLADRRRPNLKVALDFVGEAVKLAPVYYVPGNHEAGLDRYPQLREGLAAAGAVVLENRAVPLVRRGDTVTLVGLADPAFTLGKDPFRRAPALVESRLRGLVQPEEGCHILLSHRPELFSSYLRCGVDLALCGHAHGGQARLPFVGGVIAPNQGFFPRYDAGLYTRGDCSMVVSRGLGNSLCPLRFNNRPEVVAVELRSGAMEKA